MSGRLLLNMRDGSKVMIGVAGETEPLVVLEYCGGDPERSGIRMSFLGRDESVWIHREKVYDKMLAEGQTL